MLKYIATQSWRSFGLFTDEDTDRKVEEELCDMAYDAEGRRAIKGYNTSSTLRDGDVRKDVRTRVCIGTGYP